MNELFFKTAFILLSLIYILIRVPFDKTYKQQEKIRISHGSQEKILLFLLAVGLLLVPLLWVFTSYLDGLHLNFPVWLRISGIVLAGMSLIYFHRIHRILGANWSPTLEIRKGHQLIQTGPYKTIRHPMYAQIWLWTFAQIFIVSNLVAGFSGIIAFSLLYFIRVPREEKMLLNEFGDEYESYMKKTGRILPKVKC